MNLEFCKDLLGEEKVLCVDAESVFGGLSSGVITIDDDTDDEDAGALLFDSIMENATGRPHCEAECDPSAKQVVCMALIEDMDGNLLVTRERGYTVNSFGSFSLLVHRHLACEEEPYEALCEHLRKTLNISRDEIETATLEGVVLCDEASYDAAHLGILFRMCMSGRIKERLKTGTLMGKWMSMKEILRLYRENALDAWSLMVFEELFHGSNPVCAVCEMVSPKDRSPENGGDGDDDVPGGNGCHLVSIDIHMMAPDEDEEDGENDEIDGVEDIVDKTQEETMCDGVNALI